MRRLVLAAAFLALAASAAPAGGLKQLGGVPDSNFDSDPGQDHVAYPAVAAVGDAVITGGGTGPNAIPFSTADASATLSADAELAPVPRHSPHRTRAPLVALDQPGNCGVPCEMLPQDPQTLPPGMPGMPGIPGMPGMPPITP